MHNSEFKRIHDVIHDNGRLGNELTLILSNQTRMWARINYLYLLPMMFNAMLTHAFNPEYNFIFYDYYIPKDKRGLINSSNNYRVISLSNSICKLYYYVFIDLNRIVCGRMICSLASIIITQLFYVNLFILRLLIIKIRNEGSDVYNAFI